MAQKNIPGETTKSVRISRIAAIVCTVMAGIGAIVVASGSANIGESLSPTILFAIAAIVCWSINGKRGHQSRKNTADASIPKAFSRAVNEEYRKILGAKPPKGFVKEAYDEYQRWDADLKKGFRNGPAGKVYDWKLRETWEDYPEPDYDDVHTYCQVAFNESGRTYYYRTRNPELEVGDMVYVPFGYKEPKKIAVIISKEDVVGHDAPFPLEKTKFIIGKVQ